MRPLYLFLLLWMCSLAHGVELLGEPKVTVTGTTATLQWKTDVACGTRVSYGPTADQLTQKAEGPVTAAHEVVLQDLKQGSTYHYSLGSARQRLHAGSFLVTGGGDVAVPPKAEAPARKSVLEQMREVFTPGPKPAPQAPATMAQPRAPPTQVTWGRMETLRDHFERHGPDFKSRNPDEYAAQAWQHLQRGRAGEVWMKWDESDGTLRVFDPKTRAFAAYNRDGTTKTFFRPGNPSYWDRQPGRPIQASKLPF
ncbi:hypothetical protein EI77_00760 [Prosthecobacter fusiformis]|uniref:Fibronectin type-III domain-containing protein n=1 Tax=Prosthecobacter fusiformis TaxID=48464 RepID=A0A4R7SQV9_9BACT|nr:hypothetical protein [Prosthecobacter fusiformis]TDU81451.1 hypothetical protein EI77_00760 [Prosthecobacter fusiformis]